VVAKGVGGCRVEKGRARRRRRRTRKGSIPLTSRGCGHFPRRQDVSGTSFGSKLFGPFVWLISHQRAVLFISEQTSYQQLANNTFLSQQISTSHQPNEQAACPPAISQTNRLLARDRSILRYEFCKLCCSLGENKR
jgi:hypothetical protein